MGGAVGSSPTTPRKSLKGAEIVFNLKNYKEMKMKFAEGNGYKLPIARYQERQPNGKKYVTRPSSRNYDLESLLKLFKANCAHAEEIWTREEQAKYAYDVRVVCGDVVIAEKVWER